ncbi:MAG: hypothetical protein MUD16_01070 [Desulfobacterales bacterium]|jgi:hypothetical protein|nr:hypothetical protein [Desulfobacterales bacterium]
MRLKETDIQDLNDFFEEILNRAQKIEKQQKIQFRKKIRNELFFLMGWELATPSAVMSRWEERLDDVLKIMPFGFKDELARRLADKLRSPLTPKSRRLGPAASGDNR